MRELKIRMPQEPSEDEIFVDKINLDRHIVIAIPASGAFKRKYIDNFVLTAFNTGPVTQRFQFTNIADNSCSISGSYKTIKECIESAIKTGFNVKVIEI